LVIFEGASGSLLRAINRRLLLLIRVKLCTSRQARNRLGLQVFGFGVGLTS
jgi:hypothetical protein